MRLLIAILILTWLLSVVSSVLALVFSCFKSGRRFALSVVLAVIAMVIGYLGLGHWTPFSLFPQVAYVWSSDSFEFSIVSSWFFVAPLGLGAIALVLAIWNRNRGDERTDQPRSTV